MKWYNNLYVGQNATKRKHKIIKNIIRNKPQIGVYVLTLPINNENSLEIYPSYILLQKYYKNKNMFIVGISEGKEEAFEIMQQILLDCYNSTGQFLVRKYVETETVSDFRKYVKL